MSAGSPGSDIAGVILAGGLSTRMGQDKALVAFAGLPMIAHVIERLEGQVAALAINTNGPAGSFAAFGYPVLADFSADRPGPLAGIAAGLAWAQRRGFRRLATVPCDAPFLPRDLVAHLAEGSPDDLPACAMTADGVEPLFALWPVSARPVIEACLRAGELAVYRALTGLSARQVLIPIRSQPAWNLNLNAPHELEHAEQLARPGREGCP